MPRQERKKAEVKPEDMRSCQVAGYVTPAIADHLEDYAERKALSKSDVVAKALEYYLDRHDKAAKASA